MNLTREKITALSVTEEIKADLLSLFGQVEEKEGQISDLKKKIPTDSQKIVESIDYERYQSAVAELTALKQEMAAKLTESPKGENLLSMFGQFFDENS